MERLIRTLEHWSPRLHLRLVPLLGLLLCGLLVASFTYESHRQDQRFSQLAERQLASFDLHSEFLINLSFEHIALYELLTQADGIDRATLGLRSKQRLDAIQHAVEMLDAALPAATDVSDAEIMIQRNKVVSLAAAYLRNVTTAAGTPPTDSESGSRRMGRANDLFTALARNFHTLLEMQLRQMKSDLATGIDRTEATDLAFASTGAVLGALLLFLLLVLVSGQRRIGSPMALLRDVLAGTPLQGSAGLLPDRSYFAERDALVENALVGIVFLKQCAIVSCNRRFEEMFGYAPGTLVGKPSELLYASGDAYADVGRRAYPAMARGDHFSEEVKLRHYDGHAFWGEITGRAIDPDEPDDGSIWFFADISGRKHVEEEYNKLARAVEQSPVSIVITDRQGVIEYVNPRFTRVTGYSFREVVGKNPRMFQSGQTPVSVYRNIWATILSGAEWRGELLNRKKNGELFWEEASISPVADDQGGITHFIAVKEDITERKRAQLMLAEHQLQLEQLVSQRTQDLVAALENAKAADRAKDEFLANMSHEMRTPLGAILGFTHLAAQHEQDERQRNYLEKIGESGGTLLAIINDLLDLSKIAAGRMEMESISFSIRQLFERLVSVLGIKAAEKNIELRLAIAPDVPEYLCGDPLRLHQILMNLVGNAIKFTERGGVSLRLSPLRSRDGLERLRFEVCDTGIGMSDSEMAALFKPFAQADASITRRYGGTGLGLAICRKLADLMGGEISVTSSKGCGSCFALEVSLPPGSPEKVRQLPAHSWDAVRFSGARVLLVEDQPMNQQIARELLVQIGIEVVLAEDGHGAIERLEASSGDHFDLVLMDIQMPVVDGITATRIIRCDARFVGLPVIAMTAHTMEHERQAFRDAGMNDHVAKPFVPADLYAVLARWIAPEKQSANGAGKPVAHPAPDAGNDEFRGLPGVDTRDALDRFGGRADRYRHWLAVFVDEAPALGERILAELAAGDMGAAAKSVHAFKGRVGLLGLQRLQQATARLEGALRSQERNAAVVAWQDEFAATHALLSEWREQQPCCEDEAQAHGGTPRPMPNGDLRERLERLIALIERHDGDADEGLSVLLHLGAAGSIRARLSAAQEELRRFDFAAAAETLRQALEELP